MEDVSKDESQEKSENHVYKRRWWVLFLFCSMNILHGILWNTSSPLAQSLKAVYSWSDDDVVTIALLLKLADALCVFPASITGKKFGLRFQMMVIAVMLFVTSGLRCLPLSSGYMSILFKFSAIANGIAWRYVETCIGLLASKWFPPDQIMICMGICIISQAAGGGVSYIIGPLTVPTPVYSVMEGCASGHSGNNETCAISKTQVFENKDLIRNQLALLFFIEFAIVGVFFVCVLFTFPNDPEKKDEETDPDKKPTVKEVAKKLIRMRVFWLTLLPSCFVIGFFVVFRTILNIVLQPIGVSQIDAAWIGFSQSIAACAFGIISVTLASSLEGFKKWYVVFMLIVSGYCFTWLAVIAVDIIPFSLGQIYASAILGGVFVVAFLPILNDIASDIIYPLPEGTFMNFITFGTTVSSFLTLLILVLIDADYRYVTWMIVAAITLAIILVHFFPPEVVTDDEQGLNWAKVQDTTPVLYPLKTSKIQESEKENDGMFSWK